MRTDLQKDCVRAAAETPATASPRTVICEETARHCLEQFANGLRAVVLTGSLARDEASFVAEPGGLDFLSDAEFLLVFDANSRLPSLKEVDRLRQSIEADLERLGIRCHLLLSACHPDYLQKMAPHIFAYELRSCGQVLWGDAQILSLVPAFAASEIPLEDAWWLLCNRMIEHLGIAQDVADSSEVLPAALHYHTTKLYLDMATSLLVFAGEYAPTYRLRAQKISSLASRSNKPASLFPLGPFAERVAACTDSKVSNQFAGQARLTATERGWAFWQEAIEYMELLWRWELVKLTRSTGESSNRELFNVWMKHQPLARRLRGWLYVLRKQGWHRSWRCWPRWAYRARLASPRFAIYCAGSELFFQLPALFGKTATTASQETKSPPDVKALRPWLPVVRQPTQARPLRWQDLSAELCWNYNEFVVDTRA